MREAQVPDIEIETKIKRYTSDSTGYQGMGERKEKERRAQDNIAAKCRPQRGLGGF